MIERSLRQTNTCAIKVTSSGPLKHLHTSVDPTPFTFNEIIWCTSASCQRWISSSTPLKTTPEGFIEVNEYYQTSVPFIFAAGDCATNPLSPRPKAGVFAVRAGPFIRQVRRELGFHRDVRD